MRIVRLPLLALLLIIGIWSCEEPPIVFTAPQPEGLNAEPFIRPIYRGRFLCDSDSALMVVKNNIIYKAKAFQLEVTPTELENTDGLSLKDGQLYVEEWGRQLPTRIEKDSIYHSDFIHRDTLIYLDENHVLKHFRGHMVINRKMEKEKWEVMLLSLDEHLNLALSITTLPEEIEQLEAITPAEDLSTEDQTQYRISPTVIEFDELLQTQLIFQECDYFYRIPQEIEM
ncbi:MAG: hypothetical protein AAGG75_05530 [Bacteroidota bacterium]